MTTTTTTTVLLYLVLMVSAQTTPGSGNGDDDNDESIDSTIYSQDIPYDAIHPLATGPVDTVGTHATQSANNRRFTAFVASQSTNFTTIQCRNYKDFYRLLYTMCISSVLCSERYSLERTETTHSGSGGDYATTVTRTNFKKFVYRLSLRQLFIIQDSGGGGGGGESTVRTTDNTNTSAAPLPPLFLLEDKVPLEWIPRYVIQLTHLTGTSCADTYNTLAQENVAFVHSTHYMLHLYSAYVRNDYECRHVNEWLTLDAHNRPHCDCRQGKSCNNEGNYEVAIIVVAVFMILLLIIDIVAYFTNTTRVLARLDQHNRATPLIKTKQQ